MEAFDLTRHLRDRKLCYNLNVNIYNIWGDVLIEEYQTKDYSGYNKFYQLLYAVDLDSSNGI